MMERSAPIAISMTTAKSATAIIISTRVKPASLVFPAPRLENANDCSHSTRSASPVNPASPVVLTFCRFRSEKRVLILLHGYLAVGIDDNAGGRPARRGEFYACTLLYLIVYLIETLDDVCVRIRAPERNVDALDQYFSTGIDVGHIQIRDTVP